MRLLLLAAVLLLAGCTTPAAETPTPTPTVVVDPVPAPMEIAVSLVETGATPLPTPDSLGIEPASIEMRVGQAYVLNVTNSGGAPHDLVIDELGVSTGNIEPGASVAVEVTPTEAGTFKMYCSLGSATPVTSHDERGMHGEVVVS